MTGPRSKSKRTSAEIQPDAVGLVAYWKRQLYLLANPAVILALVFVAIFSWKISEWRFREIIEVKEERLDFSQQKLDSALDETNDAILRMKKLALALASPILDEISADSLVVSRGSTVEEEVANVEKISRLLTDLGASKKEISEVRIKFDQGVILDLRGRLVRSLRDNNPDKTSILDRTSTESWEAKEFESFIRDQGMAVPPDFRRSLENLTYFIEKGRLPDGG